VLVLIRSLLHDASMYGKVWPRDVLRSTGGRTLPQALSEASPGVSPSHLTGDTADAWQKSADLRPLGPVGAGGVPRPIVV
jgi:hypothetical protein